MRSAVRAACAMLGATLIAAHAAGARAAEPIGVPATAQLGGDTTVPVASAKAFTFPAANLRPEHLRAFFFGNRIFNTNWTTAPGSVAGFDGLGPTYNRVACSGCHVRDGRGRPPADGEGPLESMLLRLSVPTADGGHGPHPVYGDQLNDRAIHGVRAEGRARITWTPLEVPLADGTSVELLQPAYTVVDLAFGPLGDEVAVSPRVAPAIIGLGLLEAVPEALLEALADPEDRDGDGISGRVNRVWSPSAGRELPGRFGWTANVATLLDQNAMAAAGDIGLTTSIVAEPNCPPVQRACRDAIDGGEPELTDSFLARLTLYTRLLAVPRQRDADDPLVIRGARLFDAVGCSGCHRPTLRTGADAPLPELAGQTFHPFTDLLLHDMGEGLADGRPDGMASGREWRTAPLWGLRLIERVNGHTRLLHDGRARDIVEAILWHGGEAQAARDRFAGLAAADREALLAFLRSL